MNIENKPFCREEVAENTLSTQQNKKCCGVPLCVVLEDFVPVTSHYGFRLERWFEDRYFVLYRNNRVEHGYEITARVLRSLAIHECNYLERLNFGESKVGGR